MVKQTSRGHSVPWPREVREEGRGAGTSGGGKRQLQAAAPTSCFPFVARPLEQTLGPACGLALGGVPG